MKEHGKTMDDLTDELSRHRQKIIELIDAEERCRTTERALRESEEKCRNLVDNINDWLWEIDEHDVYTYSSPKVTDLLGYLPGEVIGKTPFDFMDEPEAKRVSELFKHFYEKREPFKSIENIKIHKSGHHVPMESGGTPIFDEEGQFKGYRGSDRDISDRKHAEDELKKAHDLLELRVKERTVELMNSNRALREEIAERKKAETALTESEAKYRELVHNANSIILRMDTKGNVKFFNEFAQRFFGYDEKDILGKNVIGTIVPKTSASGRDLAEMILDIGLHPERYMANENENMRRDGEHVWVAWTNRAILDKNGHVAEILCIGNDITELKRTEEKLLKARDELEQRVRERTIELTNTNRTLQAEIAERIHIENELRDAKSQSEIYLELIGHDINNMNQVAMGYLELALENLKMDKEDRVFLLKPLEMLKNSSRLINNVRKLKAVRSGLLPVQDIDVGAMLGELAKEYANVPGREIVIDYKPKIGCHVRANELLRDVFGNILGNAIKHSSGPLTIGIRMECELEGENEYCRVAIEDNGPGIPDDTKAKLFKAPLHAGVKGDGHGIGLYLVQTLVENYHGKIWVEDRVPGDHSKGCRFVVLLPKADRG